MLQQLRAQASSWVIRILLGFLILSFAIWGINDVFLGERDPVVAKVDGVKITRSQVIEERREEMNRLQPLLGGRLNADEAMRLGLTRQVLDTMIDRTVIALGTKELGVDISDEQVARRIKTDPAFFGSNGRFDRRAFYAALERAGMTEAFYVASLKQELASAQLNQLISVHLPVPKGMIAPMAAFRTESRKARWVLVPDPPASTIREPTPAEIEVYHKAHADRFTAPAYRDVTFVHLDPRELAKEIKVSDEAIKAAYEERIGEFTDRDRRNIEQVVFKTREQAEAAYRAAAAGKSLAEAARSVSKDVKVVSLGWVEKRDLLSGLADAVFALDKGAVSKPLKTALGWHIVRVRDVQKGRVKPLSEVRETIRNDIAMRAALDGIFELANKLEDGLAGGASLEEAARPLNLRAVRIPALDAQGRTAAGTPAKGLPPGGEFLRLAFETPEGEDSALTETPSGGFYILHVNGVKPPKLRPLAEVRDRVIAAWKAEQRAIAAQKRADKIIARVKAGKKLAAVAKAERLRVRTSKRFTRRSHDSETGLPVELMEKLFSARVGDVVSARGRGGVVVAELVSIAKPSAKETETAEEQIAAELRHGLGGDLFRELVAALRQRYTITANPEVVEGRS